MPGSPSPRATSGGAITTATVQLWRARHVRDIQGLTFNKPGERGSDRLLQLDSPPTTSSSAVFANGDGKTQCDRRSAPPAGSDHRRSSTARPARRRRLDRRWHLPTSSSSTPVIRQRPSTTRSSTPTAAAGRHGDPQQEPDPHHSALECHRHSGDRPGAGDRPRRRLHLQGRPTGSSIQLDPAGGGGPTHLGDEVDPGSAAPT